MVEADVRERLFNDVLSILELDHEQLGTYWSTLIDRYKLLGDDKAIPVCEICNSSEVSKHENKFVCDEALQIIYGTEENEETGELTIIPIGYETIEETHSIRFETPLQTIKRTVEETMISLTEVDGYIPCLDEIEVNMLGKYPDCFFETESGEVTKSQIVKQLNQVTRFINERMEEIQNEIMFTGQYQGRKR